MPLARAFLRSRPHSRCESNARRRHPGAQRRRTPLGLGPCGAAPLASLLVLAMLLAACFRERHPELLLIVNERSPISVAIGRHYAAARGVPEANVLALSIPIADPELASNAHETISRIDFERFLRDPIEQWLERDDRRDRIEILVTTKGVPLRIEAPPVPPERLLRDATGASVDAELSLLFSPLLGSPGVAMASNAYYDSDLSFHDFRRAHPDAEPRYLVARLTGYRDAIDPNSGVPRDILHLIEAARAPVNANSLWLIDEDPSLGPARDAGNAGLLAPAAAVLRALGLRLRHDTRPAFAGDAEAVQGYASWGSNDGHEAAPATYGRIDGHLYPGRFAPRALAVDFVSRNARSFTSPPRYGQSLLADLVAAGAAGCAGHVAEPSLPAVARPRILLGRYAQGVPAIEAFYRSLPYLGWMNVYVGDPLMQLDPAPADEFGEAAKADRDADGVIDAADNCRATPNPTQRDSDADGIGNACDADVDGDGQVTTSWGQAFPIGRRGDIEWIALDAHAGSYDPDHDLDGDGRVDARDVSLAELQLFIGPGPSAHWQRADAR